MSRTKALTVIGATARALVAASLLAMAACSDSPDLTLDTLQLSADPQANDNSPIAVDLVLVHQQDLVDQILALTAKDWFAKRQQFEADHPRGLTVMSWEIVPGQTLTAPITGESAAWAGIVFTKYRTPGPHRLRVDPPRADAAEQVIRLRMEEGKAVAVH